MVLERATAEQENEMRHNKMSGLYELTEAELKTLLECREALQGAIHVFERLVNTRGQREQMEFMERTYARTKQHDFAL